LVFDDAARSSKLLRCPVCGDGAATDEMPDFEWCDGTGAGN
jgi:hypothetical protein